MQHVDVKNRLGPIFLVVQQPAHAASVVLIAAKYRAPDGIEELYYFWVYENTTVADLGRVWYAATYGGEPEEWRGRIGEMEKTWTFQGAVLSWEKTLGDAGLVSERTGKVFEIA